MRILATSTPGVGHLNTLFPLLAALQRADHNVVVVTAAQSRDRVERSGFEVRSGGMAEVDRRASLAPQMPEILALPPRRRRGRYFSGFFAEAAAPIMRADLTSIFDNFRPDVVIHESAELASGPMAVARGIPHVTVCFSGELPEWAQPGLLEAIAPLWVSEGLAEPSMDDINGDLYLHPFPPAFGQRPSSGVVRPMRAESFDRGIREPPEWIEELGATRPVVYVTAGTEPASGMAPWAAMIRALGSFDIDAVATIGNHLDPATLGAIPENVRIERFVPQDLLLDRASVALSHGGAGSLLGAARRGVAQLLIPLVADQWENADAASGAGVAVTCELDQRSDTEIRSALRRLLFEPPFRDAALRVAAEVAAMPSPADHVATIEALLDG
jgi:UDP-glucoronosyl and UDP-glucosyl transferase